jgi:hypothetical protein
MGVISLEGIFAFKFGEEVVCPDCLSRDDDVDEDSMYCAEGIPSDEIWVCDRCGERIA